jgi:hypothetical protein
MIRKLTERRKGERRSTGAQGIFPLFLGSGCVAVDRRCRPTRRLNDIAVDEIDCMDYIFEILKRDR